MGREPICLSLGLAIGPVETLSNIVIKPNSLYLGVGVGQCKLAITRKFCMLNEKKWLSIFNGINWTKINVVSPGH